jgi:hypothetical protein
MPIRKGGERIRCGASSRGVAQAANSWCSRGADNFGLKRKYFLGSTPPSYCPKNKKKSAYTADQNRPKGERKSGRKDFGSTLLLINVKSRARKFPMRVLSKGSFEAQK